MRLPSIKLKIIAIAQIFLVCVAIVSGQTTSRRNDAESRILDLLFPLQVESKPYLTRLGLRFGDSATQVILVVYPAGQSEIVSYELDGLNRQAFSSLVETERSTNPDAKDGEIASKIKIKIRRVSVETKTIEPMLRELESINTPAFFRPRIILENSTQYEYWFDTWTESGHYIIKGPGNNAPQDKIVKWMNKYRDRLIKISGSK